MEAHIILNELEQLYNNLINSAQFPKGEKMNGKPWSGLWQVEYEGNVPDFQVVYILWGSDSEKPIYIGEGILGERLGEHFHKKPGWNSVQFIEISNFNMRKLLERFAITVLNPLENKG